MREPSQPYAELLQATRRLRLALLLSGTTFLLELVGGVLSNSLALISDAGHVLIDVFAIALAWFASSQALRPATLRHTFGFHRAGILAALANAVTLVFIAAFVSYEAYRRFTEPERVDSALVLGVATLGLVANSISVLLLRQGEGENLNIRSAFLHVAGDTLSSIAVILGAGVMYFTGWYVVDPLLSVAIAFVIVGSGWGIIRDTLHILMEGTPTGLNVEQMIQDLRRVRGVQDVHDVHVWSLAANLHALSAHVQVADQALAFSGAILTEINELLASKYGIAHSTIQFEHRECGLPCTLFEEHLAAGQ